MKASTQQWLDFAKADLLNCKLILEDDFLTTIVAFHSQQTVYTSSRYPSDIGMIETGKPTPLEAKAFYESAKDIYEAITKLIEHSL